jgi:hypothetical protein
MPALPWTRGRYEGTELHVLASRLHLARYRDIPRFLRWTGKIRGQLKDELACAGYTLDAHLLAKTFYTLSAWADADSMNSFVRSGEHAAMLADMSGRVADTSFAEWSVPAAELPLRWDTPRRRLPEPR